MRYMASEQEPYRAWETAIHIFFLRLQMSGAEGT